MGRSNHAWQSDNETSSNVAEALESVNELENNLDQSKESMYKLSYVVRVSANDLDELKRRCNEVKDFYDDLSVKLVRPFGDMLGLHEGCKYYVVPKSNTGFWMEKIRRNRERDHEVLHRLAEMVAEPEPRRRD